MSFLRWAGVRELGLREYSFAVAQRGLGKKIQRGGAQRADLRGDGLSGVGLRVAEHRMAEIRMYILRGGAQRCGDSDGRG